MMLHKLQLIPPLNAPIFVDGRRKVVAGAAFPGTA